MFDLNVKSEDSRPPDKKLQINKWKTKNGVKHSCLLWNTAWRHCTHQMIRARRAYNRSCVGSLKRRWLCLNKMLLRNRTHASTTKSQGVTVPRSLPFTVLISGSGGRGSGWMRLHVPRKEKKIVFRNTAYTNMIVTWSIHHHMNQL